MSAFESIAAEKVGEEYEVLFDWTPENPEDLQLVAGETITVLEQNPHGWWLGIAHRGGGDGSPTQIQKGYFPKNYVRAKNLPPPPPPRPANMSSGQSSTEVEIQPAGTENNRVSRKLNTNFISSSQTESKKHSFSLKSLKAFDDLMENGISIEIEHRESEAAQEIVLGHQVELEYSAFTWDGASTETTEFSSGSLSFLVGEEQVTSGLDLAVQQLKKGDQAVIVCGPNLAYGAAGYPPSVPPNSNVVYKVRVLSIKSSLIAGASATSMPSVPSVLLGAGVASRQSISSAGSGGGSGIGREASRRSSSKLVLVDSLAPIAEQTAELSLKDGGDK